MPQVIWAFPKGFLLRTYILHRKHFPFFINLKFYFQSLQISNECCSNWSICQQKSLFFDAAIIVIFNAIMLMQPDIFTENLLKLAFTWNL